MPRPSHERSRTSLMSMEEGKQELSKDNTQIISEKSVNGGDNVLIVDWDGPEDPDNPKK